VGPRVGLDAVMKRKESVKCFHLENTKEVAVACLFICPIFSGCYVISRKYVMQKSSEHFGLVIHWRNMHAILTIRVLSPIAC
jgi:hypothetical protein